MENGKREHDQTPYPTALKCEQMHDYQKRSSGQIQGVSRH